ncbi:hypothetical protein DdX_09356 [Ditylenchus destructor]|uniref:Uncharacterized protein n=1 Tax=Ditylenchus destructor TaxID=166010 RepID=A0AAD4N3Q7_9BILA|nr:hypothetical protein DdX_09356 [Ditylenchus destructor]
MMSDSAGRGQRPPLPTQDGGDRHYRLKKRLSGSAAKMAAAYPLHLFYCPTILSLYLFNLQGMPRLRVPKNGSLSEQTVPS